LAFFGKEIGEILVFSRLILYFFVKFHQNFDIKKRVKRKTLLQTKSVLGEPGRTIQQGYLLFGASVFFIGEFLQNST